MLAQSILSAADLGITESQRDALMKVLVLLETGKLVHVPSGYADGECGEFTGHFNMTFFNHTTDCGTVCCIGGTAELIGEVDFGMHKYAGKLHDLFMPQVADYDSITPTQAARALRSYLSTGEANWPAALGEQVDA